MQRIDERMFKSIVGRATRNVLNEQQQLNEVSLGPLTKIGRAVKNFISPGSKALAKTERVANMASRTAEADAAMARAGMTVNAPFIHATDFERALNSANRAGRLQGQALAQNVARSGRRLAGGALIGGGLLGASVAGGFGGGNNTTPQMPPGQDPYAGGYSDPYAAYGGGYSDPYAGYYGGYSDPYAGYYGY